MSDRVGLRIVTVAVWTALLCVAGMLAWIAGLSARQGDRGSAVLLLIGICLTLAPPRYDPAIRIKEWLERQ